MFSVLPKLVERAGRSERGSITAFYSVLVEGDDTNEPVSDTVRGLLDGHIILSRDIAARGHYPAIDILRSLSRLMPSIASQRQSDAAQAVRELLAVYRDHEDLISVGAYRQGSNRAVDAAILLHDEINHFLRQRVDAPCSLGQAVAELVQLAARCTAAKSMGSGTGKVIPAATG